MFENFRLKHVKHNASFYNFFQNLFKIWKKAWMKLFPNTLYPSCANCIVSRSRHVCPIQLYYLALGHNHKLHIYLWSTKWLVDLMKSKKCILLVLSTIHGFNQKIKIMSLKKIVRSSITPTCISSFKFVKKLRENICCVNL